MNTPLSLYDRYIGRPWSWRQLLVIALVLLLLPLLVAVADGVLEIFFAAGHWRIAYLPVVMILYVLMISQPLGHSNEAALRAFRSVVQVDDDAYNRLLLEARKIRPAHELFGICIGMAVGLLNVMTWGLEAGFYWSKLYLYLSMGAMYALLAWTLVVTVSWTRLTRELHRQPLQFDLFDTRPFEPVGRQSLIIALVIIGGLSISLLFTFQPESLRLPIFWIVNIIVVLIPVVIFFLSMRPTHALLAAEKKRQLDGVKHLIVNTSRELVQHMQQGEAGERSAETRTLAAELSALAVYEQHLDSARTWPYNTTQLRTLFLTGLVPVGTLIAKVISELGLLEF